MATAVTITDAYKNVSTAGTPVALGTSSDFVLSFTLKAQKNSTTANTGLVKIRPVGGTGWDEMSPGESRTITGPNGRQIKLSDWEVDAATNGDGVYITKFSSVNSYDGP